jgi:hypothetical protein
MNSSSYFFATIVAGAGLLSFTQNSSSVSETELNTAINKGLIVCESFGAGGYSGKSVTLKLVNRKANHLRIVVPVGTLFYPKDSGQQTLITVEDQIIVLAPGEKKREQINAYCSEHSDRSPNTSTVFTIGKNKNPKFDSLFAFIEPYKIPQTNHQYMVWAVSDNSPVSAISSDNLESKKLRKFLFKLTGQDEQDFTSGYIITVDENGYIVKTLYRITGDMEFNSDKLRYAYQEVYTPEGKLKYKSNMAIEIPKGISTYNFGIIVKNWPKGKYLLKMKDGKEEVGVYSFEV